MTAPKYEKPFLGVPTVLWNSLIAAVMTCVLAYMSHQMDRAATAVAEVKETLTQTNADESKQLKDIAKTGEATHILVNSAMGAQLKLSAQTSRFKANTTKDPTDIAAAELAERLLQEHQEKQHRMDRQE